MSFSKRLLVISVFMIINSQIFAETTANKTVNSSHLISSNDDMIITRAFEETLSKISLAVLQSSVKGTLQAVRPLTVSEKTCYLQTQTTEGNANISYFIQQNFTAIERHDLSNVIMSNDGSKAIKLIDKMSELQLQGKPLPPRDTLFTQEEKIYLRTHISALQNYQKMLFNITKQPMFFASILLNKITTCQIPVKLA